MSQCECGSVNRRVTGEVFYDGPGKQNPLVRVRCADCGGKVSWIHVCALIDLGVDADRLSLEDDEGNHTRERPFLDDDERVTIEVDLL